MLKKEGHDVVVFDGAPELKAFGAGIQTGPNVVRVVKAMGLFPVFEKTVATQVDYMVQRSVLRKGEVISNLKVGDAAVEHWGERHYTAHRGELFEMFRQEFQDNLGGRSGLNTSSSRSR